jgi:steroid delta-isomerase-like uncharacterized protein
MKQLAYVLAISALLASCQMNNGAKPGAVDKAAKNTATAKSYYEKAMNGHNVNAFDSIIADNYKEHFGDTVAVSGKAGFKKEMQEWLVAFPDLAFTVNRVTADSNSAAVQYTLTGTNSGALMGLPATNKKINVTGIDMYKFDNSGKISDQWGYTEDVKFRQQLGFIPSDSVLMAIMVKKDMKKK